jgi:hypothetical protein
MKKGTKGVVMVWHAVLWTLWRSRNDRIFLGKVVEEEKIVERIIFVSLKWLLTKKISAPYLFYE